MQFGKFTHQVVLSVPMAPYMDLSRRVNADFNDHIVAPTTGYLLLVARETNKREHAWECLLAGSREQVIQPSLLEGNGTDIVARDVQRLKGWLHELMATAVCTLDVSVEVFRHVQVQLSVSAELLKRASELPLTIALRAEGAFDAEGATVSLRVDTAAGLARRLGWLLEISRTARPVFQPVNGAAMDRLGLYLSRMHGRQLRRGRT
ncbi:hypothetical protein ACQHIH_21795 (plasmid) [Xanthomonas sontii]|uniref:hypothetical protein n=1 Tax=Xanthomonas sontii TaxID=2650745 RepID=UPI003F852072